MSEAGYDNIHTAIGADLDRVGAQLGIMRGYNAVAGHPQTDQDYRVKLAAEVKRRKAGYDGETCQSCEHRNKDLNRWPCNECREMSNFRISLQCRQVRALEYANKLREEANRCSRITSSALERIADSLSAREPDAEKPREPRKRKTRDCMDCTGQGAFADGRFCSTCGGLGAVLITAAGR